MIVCRVIFLLLVALWLGGFMFYGGVVVPVGTSVLQSETEQGFITQQVTVWLNRCGLVTLAFWLAVLLVDRPAGGTLLWPLLLWSLLLSSLLLLVVLHGWMDLHLDADSHSVRNPLQFYSNHRQYLIVSTLQWLGAVGLLAVTLQRWRVVDRQAA